MFIEEHFAISQKPEILLGSLNLPGTSILNPEEPNNRELVSEPCQSI